MPSTMTAAAPAAAPSTLSDLPRPRRPHPIGVRGRRLWTRHQPTGLGFAGADRLPAINPPTGAT